MQSLNVNLVCIIQIKIQIYYRNIWLKVQKIKLHHPLWQPPRVASLILKHSLIHLAMFTLQSPKYDYHQYSRPFLPFFYVYVLLNVNVDTGLPPTRLIPRPPRPSGERGRPQVRDEVVSLHEYYRWPSVAGGYLLWWGVSFTKIRLFSKPRCPLDWPRHGQK